MNNKMVKSILAMSLATTILVGGVSINTSALTTEQNDLNFEEPTLLPVPQELQYQDGNVTITKTVNIKGRDVADTEAVKVLENYLDENEITINDTYKDGSTTIIIAEEDDLVDGLDATRKSLGMVDPTNLKDEGYILAVDEANSGTILIEGKDGDGTFYGVQTLMQLISNDNGDLKCKEVRIKDEPSMKTRGSIEGFYGTPWTNQDRLNQIKFYGENKLNTYIYAPKDDIYHREKWREQYPESEMTKMKELIKVSKENKVDFVFSLSPGNDIKFTGDTAEDDYKALLIKCNAMYDMGVRSFAIFFDDIPGKQGTEQANFLNRFNTEFIQAKKDIKPLITVPTEYDTNVMSVGTTINKYTKEFSETLDPSIKVLWTGTAVVPEGIDVTNAQFVKSIYGDRVGIWWNYPVTDYIKDKLALGPVYGLDKGLANELDFFVVNPMEHADLSKIAIATGADYSWNTEVYDYNKSFVNSINNIYGELAPYMYIFANHSSRLVEGWASTGRADAPEIKEKMDTLIKKVAKGQDGTREIEELTKEFDAMIEAADKLKESFTEEELKHCDSNLSKLKALGENDKLALELLLAIRDNDDAKITSLKETLTTNLVSLNSGARVSEETALAFINDAVNYEPNAKAGFTVDNTFVAPGEEITFTNTSSISSTEFEWTFAGANIKTSKEENPVVTYEKEGVYTVSLKSKNRLGEDQIIKKGFITVSNEAKGDIVNLSIGKTAEASGYTADSEDPSKAIDGISNTKWCTVNSGIKYLTIDLGKESTISNIVISHAEIGGEGSSLNTQDYRIQISNDNENFTEVLKVTGNKKGLTNDSIPVSIARYVKLIVDTPTQGGDNAARIYEVEVRGLDKAIEMPPICEPAEDKSTLTMAVEEAEKISKSELDKVIPLVAEEFKAALAEAKEVLNNEYAAQEVVDASFDRLSSVMQKLSYFKGDKAQLIKFIEKIKTINKDNYIASSFKDLEAILPEANAIVANENALENEVNDVYDKLVRAFLKIRLKPNKDFLNDLIKKAEGLNKEEYTENTWNNLEVELCNARAVLENEEANQKETNEAVKGLELAINNLEYANNNNNNNEKPENSKNPGNSGEAGKVENGKGSINNKLPKTGGTSSIVVGGIAFIITSIGIVLQRKKH